MYCFMRMVRQNNYFEIKYNFSLVYMIYGWFSTFIAQQKYFAICFENVKYKADANENVVFFFLVVCSTIKHFFFNFQRKTNCKCNCVTYQ